MIEYLNETAVACFGLVSASGLGEEAMFVHKEEMKRAAQ